MKKTIIILFSALLAGSGFYGCKKGENDPFISLKSRNARITAKWKLTKIAGTEVSTFGPTPVTTTIAFDGTIYSETYSTGGSLSATGSFEMTVDKKAIVTYNETYTETGSSADVISGAGDWLWFDGDKNKLFWYGDVYTNLFDGGGKVDRLAGKELVIINKYNEVNNGATSSTDITYTFEKQ